MTWSDDEAALEHAIERLQKRYPGQKIEIITAFDIAHVGWEFDYQGALIRHGGVPELVIVDQTSGDERPVREILESKLEEYERLAVETNHVLAQHMVLEGLSEFATEPPRPGDEMPDRLTIRRKPDESDEAFEERKKLFDDLKKAGGRLVIGIEELPESVIERLRELAVGFPDAEIEIVGGGGTGDLERSEIAEMMIAGASLDEILAAHPDADIDKVMRWHAEEHGDDLGNTYAAREWRGIEIKRRPNDQLRKLANEYSDEELERVGGDGTGNLVSDLGLPASTGTLCALVRGLRAMIAGSAMTPAKFARDAGLTEQEVQDLFDGRIGNAVLERVIDIYDVAARRSGKRTVAEMIEKDDAGIG